MNEATFPLFSFITIILSINTILVFAISSYFHSKTQKKKSAPRKKKNLKVVDFQKAAAKNNKAMNAAVDYQRIKTAEIEIPVIAEDVLTYGPGELGAAFPDVTNLYYPEAAISDSEYLRSIARSALQVKTHEKNTGEFNRDVDGWPLDVWYDAGQKRVMVKGIVHGEENVNYVEENRTKPGFGTSAFISFLKIEKQKGTAPNGKPYDAIAKKLVNQHTAILPNIRDPKNVIVALNAGQKVVVAFNAVEIEKNDEGDKSNNDEAAKNEIRKDEDKKMTQDEFNSMMDTYQAKNKEKDELKNSIKNEIMEELKKGSDDEKNAKNEDAEEKKEPEAANEDDKPKDDDAEAANALEASDEMLKDFSTHYGVSFKTKPSLKALGKIVGIEAANTAELISALNAKRKEITSGAESKTDAKNSQEASSLSEFLAKV